jgi:acylphosphatase
LKTLHISIHGKVQGVFFRQSTKEKAIELGIKGTTRNCSDGSVEIIAEGNEENLKKFVEWCRTGPRMANVTNVDINDAPLKNFQDFRIIH